MKTGRSFAVALMMLVAIGVTAQSNKDKKIIKDAVKAEKMLKRADPGINRFFKESAGYVIFPNVGKGAFIVGAASGNGVLYEHGKMKGMADLKKLNVGLQAGGESIIEVIFFENTSALDEFEESNFAFSAQASAIALKSGVAVNAKYMDGVAVFALPKAGLMADASIGGQKFSYHSF
jgi:lipid-binding SYLF domain-containing protein